MNQRHPIMRLLDEDPRYSLEAYQFVCDALTYAQQVLGLGEERPAGERSELEENPFLAALAAEDDDDDDDDDDDAPRVERHITGQELCEAIRAYALDQYGYMSKVVLNSWGVRSTKDFGEIVFNLVRIGRLKKSDNDRAEDFDDCFDFDEAFQRRFQITVPKE